MQTRRVRLRRTDSTNHHDRWMFHQTMETLSNGTWWVDYFSQMTILTCSYFWFILNFTRMLQVLVRDLPLKLYDNTTILVTLEHMYCIALLYCTCSIVLSCRGQHDKFMQLNWLWIGLFPWHMPDDASEGGAKQSSRQQWLIHFYSQIQ